MGAELARGVDRKANQAFGTWNQAMTHGLLVSHPGTNSGRLGMRSWQYPPPGSMRPLVIGWYWLRSAVLRSQATQGSAVRPRGSAWPLHRAMSSASMSGGLLRRRNHLFKRDNAFAQRPHGFHVLKRDSVCLPLRDRGSSFLEMRCNLGAPALFGI